MSEAMKDSSAQKDSGAQKDTQIGNAMNRLGKAVESVGKRAQCLTTRIESVLRPDCPKPPCGSESSEVGDLAQLAARLSSMTDHLNSIEEGIAETEKRVEL